MYNYTHVDYYIVAVIDFVYNAPINNNYMYYDEKLACCMFEKGEGLTCNKCMI